MRNRDNKPLTRHLLWLTCLFFAAAGQAATFEGSTAVISLSSPSTPFSAANPAAVVGMGNELEGGDGSTLGAIIFAATAPAPSEYVDIGMNYIEFGLFGGLGSVVNCPSVNNCQTSPYPSDTEFLIDFSLSAINPLAMFEIPTAADLTLTDAFGIDLGAGNELVVGLDFISLTFGDILIDSIADFGVVRLDFSEGQPGLIPIPATLPLMLSGFALISFLARRKKT